ARCAVSIRTARARIRRATRWRRSTSAASTTSTSITFPCPRSTDAHSSTDAGTCLWRCLSSATQRGLIMTTRDETTVRLLTGACMCRAVQYVVPDGFGYALNCHWSNCRRTTGAAFKPFAGIQRDQLRITRGEENLLIVGDATDHDVH